MNPLEYICIFECCTWEGAVLFHAYVKANVHPSTLMATTIEHQFVKAYIYGTGKDVYWLCCDMASKNAGRVAFIGNIESDRHLLFDPKDVLSFQKVGGLAILPEELWLFKTFKSQVPLYTYEVDDIHNIVRVTHLGTSKEVEDAIVYAFRAMVDLAAWTVDGFVSYAHDNARRLQALSKRVDRDPVGDRCLQRAMLHLIYLANANTVRRPSLFQRLF